MQLGSDDDDVVDLTVPGAHAPPIAAKQAPQPAAWSSRPADPPKQAAPAQAPDRSRSKSWLHDDAAPDDDAFGGLLADDFEALVSRKMPVSATHA